MTAIHPPSPEDVAILGSCGAEWRDWILTNVSAGCAAEALYSQMVESGWTPQLANAALETCRSILGLEERPFCRPSLPPVGTMEIDGHRVTTTCHSLLPAIAVCEHALSAEECDALIRLAHDEGLSGSEVVDEDDGGTKAIGDRTSTGMSFVRHGNDLIKRIEHRLARLTQWPVEKGERLQLLHYQPGQEYKPHYDAFCDSVGGKHHKADGGQRVGTVLVYLKSPSKGGGTSFPLAGLTFCPPAGTAIVFHNVDAKGGCLAHSLHAGLPVVEGEKYVLTYWQRESATR